MLGFNVPVPRVLVVTSAFLITGQFLKNLVRGSGALPPFRGPQDRCTVGETLQNAPAGTQANSSNGPISRAYNVVGERWRKWRFVVGAVVGEKWRFPGSRGNAKPDRKQAQNRTKTANPVPNAHAHARERRPRTRPRKVLVFLR